VTREALLTPDELWQFSPVWPILDESQKDGIVRDLLELAERNADIIRVPSPAIVAIGRRSADQAGSAAIT
jgi:hypothetical protein